MGVHILESVSGRRRGGRPDYKRYLVFRSTGAFSACPFVRGDGASVGSRGRYKAVTIHRSNKEDRTSFVNLL